MSSNSGPTGRSRKSRPLELKVKHLDGKKATKPVAPDKVLEIKSGAVEKADIKLRKDLVKEQTGYKISSLTHKGIEPSFGDGVKASRKTFNFGDMVDIGKPDRDHSLRVPMMHEKVKMRKFGAMSPTKKAEVLKDLATNNTRPNTSSTQPYSMSRPSTGFDIQRIFSDDLEPEFSSPYLVDGPKPPFATDPVNFSRGLSRSESRPSTAVDHQVDADKDVIVREQSNPKLHLYRLANSGGESAGSTSPSAKARKGITETLRAPQVATPTLSASSPQKVNSASFSMPDGTPQFTDEEEPPAVLNGHEGDNISAADLDSPRIESSSPKIDKQTRANMPLYAPATFRLPKKEKVVGFGLDSPEVDHLLSSYKAHSNKAVAAAVALEEANEYELTALHDNHSFTDSFQEDQLEVFLQEGIAKAKLEEQGGEEKGVAENTDAVAAGDTIHKQGVTFQGAVEARDSARRSELDGGDSISTTSSLHLPRIVTGTGLRQSTSCPGNPASLHEADNQAKDLIYGGEGGGYLSEAARPGSSGAKGKPRVSCKSCFRAGVLWCQECKAAFCGICWGKIPHHDLTYMNWSSETSRASTAKLQQQQQQRDGGGSLEESTKPILSFEMNRSTSFRDVHPLSRSATARTNLTTAGSMTGGTGGTVRRPRSRAFTGASTDSTGPSNTRVNVTGVPTNRNSYSGSIVFSNYETGKGRNQSAGSKEQRYRSAAAAMIPLPDEVVVRYEDYPACVYVDGKGQVGDIDPSGEEAHVRPYTSPAVPAEQLHLAQLKNHQRRLGASRTLSPDARNRSRNLQEQRRQQEQANEATGKPPKSAPMPSASARGGGARKDGVEEYVPNVALENGVKYGMRYRGVLMPGSKTAYVIQHSMGKVVVKRGRRNRSNGRAVTPAFNATGGPGGGVSFAYDANDKKRSAQRARTPQVESGSSSSGNRARPAVVGAKLQSTSHWIDDLFAEDYLPKSDEPYDDNPDPFKRENEYSVFRHKEKGLFATPAPAPEVMYFGDKSVLTKTI